MLPETTIFNFVTCELIDISLLISKKIFIEVHLPDFKDGQMDNRAETGSA